MGLKFMNYNISIKFILLTHLLISSAQAAEIKITGSIYPAGSFELRCSQILGLYPVKNKKIYKAKLVKAEVKCFKSEIELRDEHFYKFLKADLFPYLSISNLTLSPKKSSGLVKIQSIEKMKNLEFKEKGKNFLTSFEISLEEFQLVAPNYMGAKVKDSLLIEVKGELSELRTRK